MASRPFALPNQVTTTLPPHLAAWTLPPDWQWGASGVWVDATRHCQELVDALGRSLSLVTAADPAHHAWLRAEAEALAHRAHGVIPTTYHYWIRERDRGPGYLRRWIPGEPLDVYRQRRGPDPIPHAMQVLRALGSAVASLHDAGVTHGAVTPEAIWRTPLDQMWLVWWHWASPLTGRPADAVPDLATMLAPPEWLREGWAPTAASDQWQLAGTVYALLTGEAPQGSAVPPIQLLRPDVPGALARVLDRAMHADPAARYPSVTTLLRDLERASASKVFVPATGGTSIEAQLRWATADEYEVRQALGQGSFGCVWRVRDLALQRDVALKMLHPAVAQEAHVVARFQREAQLAAQLTHPAILPVLDWDARGEIAWYTMPLAEAGSLAEHVQQQGPLTVRELAPQVDAVLDGLAAAHATGVIHRDLKPENILLDGARRWRIADFGVANVDGLDATGSTGTPAFAAPEQLLGEAQGPAVDLYAVAAIVHAALTGQPPYGDGAVPQVLARALRGFVPASADARIPTSLVPWLVRGLHPDPAQRFPDAAAMRRGWNDAVARLRAERVAARASRVEQPLVTRWVRQVVRHVIRRGRQLAR